MVKISQNFDIREFVPKSIYDRFGDSSTWFISEKVVKCAEFYKSFFTTYFKNKYGSEKVKSVAIVVNNWHVGGSKQFSGFRPPDYTEGGTLSQHRMGNAFDCEIIVVMNDGSKAEANYVEIHKVIKDNEAEFMANGVTRIEDVSIASGWLHTDFAFCPGIKNILIVKP